MAFRAPARRTALLALAIAAAAFAATCDSGYSPRPLPRDKLAPGTWGGDSAGVIVSDTIAHVHVGCTYGDFHGPVALDQSGRFSVSGNYLLRAYPIPFGPTLPAVFAGVVEGSSLTLTVAVNDTVQHKPVVLGPVKVTFGREPSMGPCPICRTPPGRS